MNPYTVGKRLEDLIKALGLNPNSFSVKTGIPVPTIHYIIGKTGRKTNPSFNVVQKIAETFQNVNIRWFLTGYGPMFTGSSESGDTFIRTALVYKQAMLEQQKAFEKMQIVLDDFVKEKRPADKKSTSKVRKK